MAPTSRPVACFARQTSGLLYCPSYTIALLVILLAAAAPALGQQPGNTDTARKIRVKLLDTVIVAEPPMILKKDTIAYNASRYHTAAYAPLSDLLDKLPGIRVNDDGTASINGQPVDRILVDGKPFFAGDPKLALQHLPADIIRQVQVYPTAYEQRGGLPGSPPGNKTINLVLKNNRRKGDFGKLALGAGVESVYAASMDLHDMHGARQMSIIGDAGNVDGFESGKPAPAAIAGVGAYGIRDKWNAGINYRDQWTDATDAYGSFTNSQQHTKSEQKSQSLNLFPGDASTLLEQHTTSVSRQDLQHLNFNIETRLDKDNSLIFRPDVQLSHSSTQSSQQITQRYAQSNAAIYNSSGDNNTVASDKRIDAGLQYIHKGRQALPSLLVNLDIFSDRHEQNGFNFSRTHFSTATNSTGDLDQHTTSGNSSLVLSPSIEYKIPLNALSLLDIQMDYSYIRNEAINATFRRDSITQQFDHPDSGQTNAFDNVYQRSRGAVNYRVHWSRWSINLGAGVQSDQMQSKDFTKGGTFKNQYLNLLPSASVSMDWQNAKSIQLSYSGKPVSLTLQQLQPVAVTTDSLFIQRGNPLLKQPFMHSFSVSYTSLHMGTQRFFSAMLSGSLMVHSVQNDVRLLSNGARVSMPVNMNGAGNVYANFNYVVPAPRLRSNVTLAGNIRYSRDPGISNGLVNNTHMVNFSGEVSWDFHSPGGIDLRAGAAAEYNVFHYPLDPGDGSAYFVQSFSFAGSYTRNDWKGSLMGYYSLNNSLPKAFRTLAPVLSPAISRRLLKHRAAEVRLSVTDLLNQRSGASRTVTANAVTDVWAAARGRYGLLSFVYNMSRFKSN